MRFAAGCAVLLAFPCGLSCARGGHRAPGRTGPPARDAGGVWGSTETGRQIDVSPLLPYLPKLEPMEP